MLNLKNINTKKVGFFRFKEFEDKYLLTNDVGDFVFLEKDEFEKFIQGKLDTTDTIYDDLLQKGFIKTKDDNILLQLIKKFRSKNLFLAAGPSLHIVIPTLRCNHKCIYCQASAVSVNEKGYDMDIDTAKAVIDTIFCTSAINFNIEFQGGEPLLNWEVVEFMIKYIREKAKLEPSKKVNILIVTNLTLIDEKKLQFLIKNKVGICTSLDGPEEIHNKNRSCYNKVVKNIKMVVKRYKKEFSIHLPAGIVTVTKYSLDYPKEIVDEYLNLGFEGIFIRPFHPMGCAKIKKKELAFTAEEYINFYTTALDYILNINKQSNEIFYELTALIFLTKILTSFDPNFMDIRSPCGAGIGQLAYNYNGDVYTCDEGRMLAMMGDESFKIGNVKENTYKELIDNPVVKTMCVVSCLDGLIPCNNCVYKPYCGVCPIYNYVETGDIFIKIPNNKCKIFSGILDYLFQKIQIEEDLTIFNKWINIKRRGGDEVE